MKPQFQSLDKKKKPKSKGSTISNPQKGKMHSKSQTNINKTNSPSSKNKRTTTYIKTKMKVQMSANTLKSPLTD